METLVASLEEISDLVGSSQTSVDVGFFSLGTHLLRCSEVTAFECLEFGIGIWHDVADVLEVGTFSHQFQQTSFVDDFLTGGVDQDATFVHLVDNVVVDAELGFSCCRNVQRNDVAGLELETLNKKDFADIKDKTSDPRVLEMVRIRAEMAKTSNKKWGVMQNAVCEDGRVHGILQFYGTRTGRWAGRLVQMQNLPQNHIDGLDLDLARQAVKMGDIELLAINYGNVPETLSQLIRTAFIPTEGKYYAVCDFSAIEARVLAWMAGEDWLLEVFRTHGKVYEASAAKMYHCDISEITKTDPRRQKGKISVLALGYQGGTGALDAMGGKRMGLSEEDEAQIVKDYREAHPSIVKFWYDVEDAAKACAIQHRTVHLRNLTFEMQENGTMTITLPSGRPISYPAITGSTNRFGKESLKFRGVNQESKKWGWIETYGGKLTENIIQAVARDCLAETMVRVEAAGFPVVFHVHDELICEVENTSDLDKIQEIFKEPIPWAEDLPLKGAGYTGNYYFKD